MNPAIADLTFGVEFEVVLPPHFSRDLAARELARRTGVAVDSHSHPAGNNWKIVTDGSIRGGNGWEFVSPHNPPLKGQAGLDQVTKIANGLREISAAVNTTTGFHVHVGVPVGAGLDFFKNLVKLYGRFEEVIDSIMPSSRRGNGAYYCRSVKLSHQRIDEALNVDQLAMSIARASHADGVRYHKVNLAAFRKHSTVEFRQHGGTVDAAKAVNWIGTCLRLVAAAKAGKTGEETAQRIAWDLTRLVGKQAHVAHLISRPEGATNAEIKAAFGGIIKGARSHLKKANLPYRVARDRATGKPRFFADMQAAATVAAPAHPVTLDGLADLLDLDADHRAYLARRRAAVNPQS